ncbi:hypothetical protein MKEN_00730400 [Mycena kentingensis (nom. inval.)]|nr:hypothetical protein MKEN_00730400 [Mycena kentingensis (nom. inval.)]
MLVARDQPSISIWTLLPSAHSQLVFAMLRLRDQLRDAYAPFTCQWAAPSLRQPLKPPPDLPLEIWLEIFQFATYVQRQASIEPRDPFTIRSPAVLDSNTPSTSMHTKCTIVAVCRAWRRIGVHLLYQYIPIRSPLRATLVLRALRASHDEDYGHWTRHIEVHTHARRSNGIQFLQNVFRILQFCPRLRILSATWHFPVPKEFLAAVSALYGSTLQGLYWDEQKYSVTSSPVSPSFFASFQSLRVLDLRDFVGNVSADSSHPTLPSVQHLILSNKGPNIDIATRLTLPVLRTLTIYTLVGAPIPDIPQLTTLLTKHGRTLTTVNLPSPATAVDPLGHGHDSDAAHHTPSRSAAAHIPPALFLRPDACPVLDTLAYSANSALPAVEQAAHPTLRRIALYSVRAEKLYPRPPVVPGAPRLASGSSPARDPPPPLVRHLRALTRAAFPALETVRTAGFFVALASEPHIRDVFIQWREHFERDGIDFLDGEGILWEYEPELELEVEVVGLDTGKEKEKKE